MAATPPPPPAPPQEDPKGRPVEEVRATRDEIARRVEELLADLDGARGLTSG
jgi:hypothetical protein